MADHSKAGHRPDRFLLLYALAWAGASISYIPFLTILLPVRVTVLVGHEQAMSWLAYIAFAGAIAASIGHIGFGYLSDITGNRRLWIWSGLTLSSAFLVAVPWAVDLPGLIAVVVCWQLSLNMMLAPLAAMGGDYVPNSRKGLLGGLMAFAPGLGAFSGALISIPGLASADFRLALLAAMVIICVAPVLITGTQQPTLEHDDKMGEPVFDVVSCDHTYLERDDDSKKWHHALEVSEPHEKTDDNAHASGQQKIWRSPLLRMWLARLTVQVGEAALFAFLYIWFRSIDPAMNDNRTASVFSAILIISAPLSLAIGSWADRRDRPLLPLVICAGISATGLIGMAFAKNMPAAIGTYALFGIASSVFLAQHSAQTLRILPRADRRGRDLGYFNLTNTVPSLIMPWFALILVPYFGFSGLFILLAALSGMTVLLMVPIAGYSDRRA